VSGQPEAPAAPALTREQVREMISTLIEQAWWSQDDAPVSKRVTDAIWPMLEAAEADRAKLATLAAHNRGHLELPGSCCPHLAQENLAIIDAGEPSL
jgi:hypothetical protein